MRVIPVGIRGHGHVNPGKAAVGRIQHIYFHLVAHHTLLVLQVFVRYSETAHAIGFGPQHRLQFVRGHHLKIIRKVEPCGSVQHSAVLLHQFDELHLAEVLGALKHHVFEQMSEAGAIPGLNTKADAVIDTHTDRRRRAILRKHDAQAVR